MQGRGHDEQMRLLTVMLILRLAATMVMLISMGTTSHTLNASFQTPLHTMQATQTCAGVVKKHSKLFFCFPRIVYFLSFGSASPGRDGD